MREYTYAIDEEGLIWLDGEDCDEPELHRQFYRHLARDEKGRLYAICQGEKCWIIPKDTPFVVQMVRAEEKDGVPVAFTLVLNASIEEPLDPASLSVGKANVLYTTVKKGAFPARFTRKAYYELARFIEKDGGTFSLVLGGKRYPVANAVDE